MLKGKHVTGPGIVVLAVAILASGVHAEAGHGIPPSIGLYVGQSRTVSLPYKIKRAAIASPEVADVLVVSPREIYLTGKAPGATTLIVWDNEGNRYRSSVQVSHDLSRLKEQLHRLLPDADIKVAATKKGVILWGDVPDITSQSIALELAREFAAGNVINLLQVGGKHQVMLEVRVSEMSRGLMKRLGINLAYISSRGGFGVSMLDKLITLDLEEGNLDITYSDRINALFRFFHGRSNWTGFIDALKEERLIKILAEPTLVAMSGQKATFLVGGEFPVPVPQTGESAGTVTIEWKQYGVGLTFVPTVLSPSRISIRVSPEVSEIDYTNAVNISGYVVPGILTRRTSTTVELSPGQSFAIAGLLRENARQAINKFPVLGDIPIIGMLFRSTQFQKSESELVVIVTPQLVEPMAVVASNLPTDSYVEPGDYEFYVKGQMAGSIPQARLTGQFGHIIDWSDTQAGQPH